MLTEVAQGSKEELVVIITDIHEVVDNLASSVPKYDIWDNANNVYKRGDGTYANAVAATASGMKILAEVDHNSAGVPWAVGDYSLFVWFTVGTQVVRKGPFEYSVVGGE